MKIKFVSILFLFLFFLINSCKEDDSPENPLLNFVGEFEMENEHTTGLHAMYDSVGNLLGYEEQTVDVNHNFTITDDNLLDSLSLTGLINSWSGSLKEVKIVLQNDSLDIIYNKSGVISNDYIIGKIWMEGDSIFTDYRWDKSDTWSTGAIPVYGKVIGRGVRTN